MENATDEEARFWSEKSETERFQVEYQGRCWTGYKSLLACLRRALDDGIPITTPSFWCDPQTSDEALKAVFQSATDEEMPLLDERISMLREAGIELIEVRIPVSPRWIDANADFVELWRPESRSCGSRRIQVGWRAFNET